MIPIGVHDSCTLWPLASCSGLKEWNLAIVLHPNLEMGMRMSVTDPVEGLQLAYVLASGSFIELLIILVRAEPGAISWTFFRCTSAVILC